MSDRTAYYLFVDFVNTTKELEFSDKQKAISEAKRYFYDGAFSVRVYHYTNGGANCVDDYYNDLDEPENELVRDDGQFGMGA